MGWVFPSSETEVSGADPDHLNGAKSVRELYEIASPNYTGKYTVPVSLFCFTMSSLVGTRWCEFWYFNDRFYGIRSSRPL